MANWSKVLSWDFKLYVLVQMSEDEDSRVYCKYETCHDRCLDVSENSPCDGRMQDNQSHNTVILEEMESLN
jgi:hypothetical protein